MSLNGSKSWKQKAIEPKITPFQVVMLAIWMGYSLLKELGYLNIIPIEVRFSIQQIIFVVSILGSGNFDFKKFLLKCRDVFDSMSPEDRQVMNLLENIIKEAFYHWNMRYERDPAVVKIETKEEKIARIQKELKAIE